jgi:hypothetical protein
MAMSDVAAYLDDRFLRADAFAAHCRCSREELASWIAVGLAPAPAYRVDSAGTMHSHVFGAVVAHAPEGDWFNPYATCWIGRARVVLADCGGDARVAAGVLHARFRDAYREALRDSHAVEGPIPGLSDEAGQFDEVAFDEQFPGIWEHFLAGTYGLCVAQPSSEAHIVAKEATQARLTHVTANGTRRNFSDREKAEVRELIGRYEVLSMPFSPAEYPRSSRKRLIEDMLPHVAADPMRVEAPTP